MKKIVFLLLLVTFCVSSGCKKEVNNNENTSVDAITTTVAKEEPTTEAPTEAPTKAPEYTLEEGNDGSFVKMWKNENGKITKKIEYSAANNKTIFSEYRYDSFNVQYFFHEYIGEGNLAEEFEKGNFSGANEESFADDSYSGGYEVDIANAFTVTREDLAPLYAKAKNISDKYGVIILIADKIMEETGGALPCYEYAKIEPCLEYIDLTLSAYPKDFFKNFSDMNVERTVCIQLVDEGYAPGVYFSGGSNLMLQMDVNCVNGEDNGDFFVYTLHHEIGHAINDRLFTRAPGLETALTEEKWNTFNPPGFEYGGDERENEVFLEGDNSLYFTYSYGCNNPEEDRATIFGYAMSYYHGYQDESYAFNEKVDAKLKYLSQCIRAGFRIETKEKLPWEYILDV